MSGHKTEEKLKDFYDPDMPFFLCIQGNYYPLSTFHQSVITITEY